MVDFHISEAVVALVDEVTKGRLPGLIALRDHLAAELQACESSRDVAALSRQLTDVLQQIEAAEKASPEEKGSPLDELAKRRAERKPAASRRSGA